jgi:uncharacterized protein YecE (DUF72 family)
MTRGTFIGIARDTPEKFQSSIKVPETITHKKRLSIDKGAITDLEEFLDKISPLKEANKLGAVLIRLPPSFTVDEFIDIEGFLDRLPRLNSTNQYYQYAIEFKHPSWNTEGPMGNAKAIQYCRSNHRFTCKRKFTILIKYYSNCGSFICEISW